MKKNINITIENIWQFNREHKLNNKDSRLLFEAFRRLEFLGTKTIDDKFLGLGTPSAYKSVYFTSSFGKETPRVNNWYKLTEEGKRIVKAIQHRFAIPKKTDQRNKINEMLFSY